MPLKNLFVSTDCQSVIDLCHNFSAVYDKSRGEGWNVPKESRGNLQDEQPNLTPGGLK